MPWLSSSRRTCTDFGISMRKFRIARQVMDLVGVAAGERTHRLDALPIRDRHELGLVRTILARRLHAERFLDQRLDADLVIVGFVFVGARPCRAAAPDADDVRLLSLHHSNRSARDLGETTHSMLHGFAARPLTRQGK